jgi:hypothetical protein
MAKHTPGPWVTRDPLSDARRVFMPSDTIEVSVGPRGGLIACLYATNWGEPGQDAANAQLIAAAPDMLEALQFVQAVFGALGGMTPDERDRAVQAVNVAVAKAEGR